MRTSMPGPPGMKLSSRLVKETKPAPPRGKEVALETGPRGRLERGPRERVLEEVLLGAVVEQVAHFDVDPERPGHAQAGACIDADLGGQVGGAVRVPRRRRGELDL